MKIPTIMHGDDSAPIAFTAPEAVAELCAVYQGVTRHYQGVSAGTVLTIGFSAAETASFRLGTYPLVFVAKYASGKVKTYPITARIKVTDSPALVYSADVVVDGGSDGGLSGVDVLPDHHTQDDMAAKINEVIRKLGGGAAATALAVCLSAFGVSIQTAPLGQIYNDTPIVTNVTVDATPDFSTNNAALVSTIEATAPAPGNYAAVSNRAMQAVTNLPPHVPVTVYSGDFTVSNFPNGVLFDARSGVPIDFSQGGDGIPYSAYLRPQNIYYSGPSFYWLLPVGEDGTGEDILLASKSDVDTATNDLALAIESAGYVDSGALNAYAPKSSLTAVSNVAASADTKASTAIAYLQGEDVRVVVTNYDSVVHMPSASIQQQVDEDGSNTWSVVWNELTRWTWLVGTYLPTNYYTKAETDARLDEKADRAWGFYDSHTGEYAPDGYTWLSSPKIAIAGGLAYQRTLTVDGAVWVLASNGLVAETGGTTNGFFRIKDDEGNTTFEIVRGNKRTVGAAAAGIRVTRSGGSNVVTIPYNVVSEDHPTVYGTTSLSSPEWTEIAATWTGQSGAWTAQVTTASSQYFIKGEYEVGGETYIKNVAPISAEGGIYCTDGVHKVRPVYNNGSITWEVVQ